MYDLRTNYMIILLSEKFLDFDKTYMFICLQTKPDVWRFWYVWIVFVCVCMCSPNDISNSKCKTTTAHHTSNNLSKSIFFLQNRMLGWMYLIQLDDEGINSKSHYSKGHRYVITTNSLTFKNVQLCLLFVHLFIVNDELVSVIGRGFCVLVGISHDDTIKDVEYM